MNRTLRIIACIYLLMAPAFEFAAQPLTKLKLTLEDNSAPRSKLAEYTIPEKEFLKIKTAEELDVDAWMIKTPGFNPEKKYPVMFFIYGEPANATVRDVWSANLWDQMPVNELIKQNKYFTMIDYPIWTHSIKERENTTMHLRMTMLNSLKKNLPAGAKQNFNS